MKTLAKITFFIISALSTLQLSAQCTPDNNMPKGSILPQSIKIGYKDVAYSEVNLFSEHPLIHQPWWVQPAFRCVLIAWKLLG